MLLQDIKTQLGKDISVAKTMPAKPEVICDKSICSNLSWKYNTKTQKYDGGASVLYINDDSTRIYLRDEDGVLTQDQVRANDIFTAVDAYSQENPDGAKAVSDGFDAIEVFVAWLIQKAKDGTTF